MGKELNHHPTMMTFKGPSCRYADGLTTTETEKPRRLSREDVSLAATGTEKVAFDVYFKGYTLED